MRKRWTAVWWKASKLYARRREAPRPGPSLAPFRRTSAELSRSRTRGHSLRCNTRKQHEGSEPDFADYAEENAVYLPRWRPRANDRRLADPHAHRRRLEAINDQEGGLWRLP